MAPPVSQLDLDLMLAKTRDLFGEMRKQRIFITGGTGFFGCWLIESFAHANRELGLDARATILTRDPAAFARKCPHLASDPAITLLTGDVRDFAYPDGDFQYVIHAATESSGKQKPLQMTETIVRGMERVLEFAATRGTRKFLFTSSGAVYGSQPASIPQLAEEYAGAPYPLDHASAYAQGKREAEAMCAAHNNKYGYECKIARGFAFVGPHLPLDAHFAIGNFIRDAMRGVSIEVNGDGTSKRSYMYAADLAIWLWTILLRGRSNQAFNVGSDQAISILELAHAVAAALRSPATVRVAQKEIAGASAQLYIPSTRKAQQDLGLHCEVALEEAIRRTAAWHGYLASR
jgi:nucleoside-diphosphate-sugar epimerase